MTGNIMKCTVEHYMIQVEALKKIHNVTQNLKKESKKFKRTKVKERKSVN